MKNNNTIIAIVGPQGSGKSKLFNSLTCGLEEHGDYVIRLNADSSVAGIIQQIGFNEKITVCIDTCGPEEEAKVVTIIKHHAIKSSFKNRKIIRIEVL